MNVAMNYAECYMETSLKMISKLVILVLAIGSYLLESHKMPIEDFQRYSSPLLLMLNIYQPQKWCCGEVLNIWTPFHFIIQYNDCVVDRKCIAKIFIRIKSPSRTKYYITKLGMKK
jgi:hypothetical protein